MVGQTVCLLGYEVFGSPLSCFSYGFSSGLQLLMYKPCPVISQVASYSGCSPITVWHWVGSSVIALVWGLWFEGWLHYVSWDTLVGQYGFRLGRGVEKLTVWPNDSGFWEYIYFNQPGREWKSRWQNLCLIRPKVKLQTALCSVFFRAALYKASIISERDAWWYSQASHGEALAINSSAHDNI